MALNKFKFVEMFINPETGSPYEDTGSPKLTNTIFFGTKELHQIARIIYEKRKIVEKEVKIGKDGKVADTKEKVSYILVEKMGEKGGWIEKSGNLSQGGNCWVGEGGIVCDNGFVGGDVNLIAGVVGENAKVVDEAKIMGITGIGGNAYVCGKAQVNSNREVKAGEEAPPLSVSGTARVEGKVKSSAIVTGSSYVGPDATVEGQATVTGNAQVFGKVGGKAVVRDAAVVYGSVSGKAVVGYEAVILESGKVAGEAVVESGIIGGEVTGKAVLSYGQVFLNEGSKLTGQSTAAGNAFIMGTVDGKVEIDNNGSVLKNGKVTGGTVRGNGAVYGTVTDGSVAGNGLLAGKMSGKKTALAEGARVGEGGNLNGGACSGSSNLGGTSQKGAGGNAVVAPGASADKVIAENEVFVEDDKNREPAGAAVICPVETGD